MGARVLIAPDKFRGTLSAREAADVIAAAIGCDHPIIAPMADGGEGTAEVMCGSLPGWMWRGDHYYNHSTRCAVMDSSAVIGHDCFPGVGILERSSYRLGMRVAELLGDDVEHLTLGVGGTATCDGGLGFYLALKDMPDVARRMTAVVDVETPFFGALDFAPQKGATEADLKVLRRNLERIVLKYPAAPTPCDGAGGGLGRALAGLLGVQCRRGADYFINSYNVDWDSVGLIVTGEGSVDALTARGKVVARLAERGATHGIPVVAIGGRVDPSLNPLGPADAGCIAERIAQARRDSSVVYISTDRWLADQPLTSETARRRLSLAASLLKGVIF